MRAEWVVVYDGSNGKPPMMHECLRCGQHYTPRLPMPVDLFVAMGRAFIKAHRGCRPTMKPHPAETGRSGLACGVADE